VATFVILLARRRVTLELLKKSLLSTIVITSMTCMLLAGSSLINFIFNYLNVPSLLSGAVVSMALSPLSVFILVVILYVILGMFIDGISMIVLTASTVCPLMTSLGFDAVWFGIILVLLVETRPGHTAGGRQPVRAGGDLPEGLLRPDLPGRDPLHRGAAVHGRGALCFPQVSALASQHM